MNNSDIITVWLPIGNLLALATGLAYSLIQLRLIKKQLSVANAAHSDNHQWNRMIASYTVANETVMGKILPLKTKLLSIVGDDNYFAGRLTVEKGDTKGMELYLIANELCSYYEFYSIQINNNVVDEHLAYKLMAPTLVRDFDTLTRFIKELRVKEEEVHAYIDFERRADLWRAKLAENRDKFVAAIEKERKNHPPLGK